MASRPIDTFLARLEDRLREREMLGLRRRLEPAVGIDFASNDYLGLSRHPCIRRRMLEALEEGIIGSPASRLLRGNHPAHERVEMQFASFKNAEAALFFSTGYLANIGLCQALIGDTDLVCSDALNHASIIDGLRLARPRKQIYAHGDAGEVENMLKKAPGEGNRFIITESLFSMDGDCAPLVELADIAAENEALLLVDEAHATGVFGAERGSGLVEESGIEKQVLATVSTCGKALGLAGAFVTGPRPVIDQVINHARSFIYTTAPVPALAEAIGMALEVIVKETWRRQQVRANARYLRQRLREGGLAVEEGDGPIVPVPIGDNHRAMSIAAAVQRAGYDVRALRPPTVPPGTARLRISVHTDHTSAELDGVAKAIAAARDGAVKEGES